MKERALLLAICVALAGCATPAPAPPAARPSPPPHMIKTEPKPERAAPGPLISLVCDPGVRKISFPSIGIPLHSAPLDIALTEERVWLLVNQQQIVEVGRKPEQATFRTIAAEEGASWDAMAVDPLDGSLWVVSLTRLELIHLIPGGRSQVVRIPKLEGEGGFRDVLVDEEGVYVVPTCAEHALWKVDRKGKVLDRAFQREADKIPLTLRTEFTPEEGQGSVIGCLPVSLARDLSGRITVFDGVDRTFYRRESETWTPVLQVPDPNLPAGGVRVDHPGTEDAVWVPGWGGAGNALGFFFLGEAPVFQPTMVGDRDEVAAQKMPGLQYLRYVRPGTEGVKVELERCKDFSWFAPPLVVTDRHGFVSTLDNHLILGTFGGTDM
ncbi:MAG TPA: hypothetical protein VFR31_07030 [Thermoanaerobaculia bacterium]|nr:hypothetical protein [Thermoanaerobaculia bacterium]